jgi:hypothetical protein
MSVATLTWNGATGLGAVPKLLSAVGPCLAMIEHTEMAVLKQPVKPTQESLASAASWEAGAAPSDEVRFFQGPQPRSFELGRPSLSCAS